MMLLKILFRNKYQLFILLNLFFNMSSAIGKDIKLVGSLYEDTRDNNKNRMDIMLNLKKINEIKYKGFIYYFQLKIKNKLEGQFINSQLELKEYEKNSDIILSNIKLNNPYGDEYNWEGIKNDPKETTYLNVYKIKKPKVLKSDFSPIEYKDYIAVYSEKGSCLNQIVNDANIISVPNTKNLKFFLLDAINHDNFLDKLILFKEFDKNEDYTKYSDINFKVGEGNHFEFRNNYNIIFSNHSLITFEHTWESSGCMSFLPPRTDFKYMTVNSLTYKPILLKEVLVQNYKEIIFEELDREIKNRYPERLSPYYIYPYNKTQKDYAESWKKEIDKREYSKDIIFTAFGIMIYFNRYIDYDSLGFDGPMKLFIPYNKILKNDKEKLKLLEKI